MTYKLGNAYYRKVYEGNWVDGMREGRGEITWNNGAVYVGDHKNDKMEGRGTFTCAYGAVFVGDYINDNMDGSGTWADGASMWGSLRIIISMDRVRRRLQVEMWYTRASG